MGVFIRATGLSDHPDVTSSLEHATIAAKRCLAEADVNPKDIDLLINTGIYRDRNLSEPAIAALIQKELDMNLLYEGSRTLSFDVVNGPCGFLSAIKVCESFFASHTIQKALIVSGDIHPSGSPQPDFPFRHMGTAALVEYSADNQKGFQAVDFNTAEDEDFIGMWGYMDWEACGCDGRNHIRVDIQDGYIDRLQAFIRESIPVIIDRWEKNGTAVDVKNLKFIMPFPGKHFGRQLVKKLPLFKDNPHEVPCFYGQFGDPHSSAATAAYHQSILDGYLNPGDTVLFVSGGSGLTVSLGIYTIP